MNIDGIDTGTNLTSSGKIATECLSGSGSSTSSQNRPRESSVYRTASLIFLSDDLTAAIFVQITPPGDVRGGGAGGTRTHVLRVSPSVLH